MNTDDLLSFLLVVAIWGPRGAWELVLLVRRRLERPVPKTISQVMRGLRYRVTSEVYLSAGMLTHFYWPWREAGAVGGVAFWLIAVGLLAWDVAWRSKPLEEWPVWAVRAKDSRVWLVGGLLAGLLLFPQGPT